LFFLQNMISGIVGKVCNIFENTIEVETQSGVIYEIFATRSLISGVLMNSEVRRVDVLQIIKEDGHFLYGFYDKDEKEWFARLTKVSGVGAKFAISILSTFDTDSLYDIIISGDEKSLTRASGVGAKLASRIVNEMQAGIAKISKMSSGKVKSKTGNDKNENHSIAGEAVEVCVALGFERSIAYKAVKDVISEMTDEEKSMDQIVQATLSKISRV
jgi:holliday junction DNA helicase RuvA